MYLLSHLYLLITIFAFLALFSSISSNPNNVEWSYDDPRWKTYIPNWWDEPNFVPPVGPVEENPKEFWISKAEKLLDQKLNYRLNTNRAKNIIIMVGDGMGLSSQMAARSYIKDVNFELSFEKFPFSGLAKIYCVNYQVPDSASTATALFSGIKTNYMVLGVTADVNVRNCSASKNEKFQVPSIFKYAQDAGKSTGIVTNTRITHATPAGAYATAASRNWEGNANTPDGCDDIGLQLIHGNIGRNLDVILGGGSRYLLPTSRGGRRTDERNLINEYLRVQIQNRKRPARAFNRDELLSINANVTDSILGIFADNHMDYKLLADPETQPTLTEMTAKALDILKKNERHGFVLMVEGGRIDHGHHENRAQLSLEEVVEFHKAVEYVKANTHEEDTLIVVTADHSHPFTIGGYLPRGRNILGPGDFSREDNMWIFSASYAQGQGYFQHFDPKTGGRRNPRGSNYMNPSFRQPVSVPMDEGTHSGEDVGVYSSGPWSHLFTGVYEQNFIPHAMMFAACITPTNGKRNANC
ncbi:hypothetical protein ACKWTF_016637 [Chironomus riparius]